MTNGEDCMSQIQALLDQVNWIDLGSKTVAALLAAAILKWAGVFRSAKTAYLLRKARRNYQRLLTEECSSLIVIGRRKGFSIGDVFIPLDIAPSELMARDEDKKREPRPYQGGSYILVGGPGAGKSTLVKKEVLDRFSQFPRQIPLFIRLREYVAHESIEHCLLAKLENAKYPSPEAALQHELSSGFCFCVLDGLDEVRPQLRDKVYRDINHFYSTHFAGNERSRLIVTCRKEAYRGIPLDLPQIWEVRPLTDEQIKRFAEMWPPKYPPRQERRDVPARLGGVTPHPRTGSISIAPSRWPYAIYRIKSWNPGGTV
jgi:predicted NACHT family NTPase